MRRAFIATAVDHVTAFHDSGYALVREHGAAAVKLALARGLIPAADGVIVDVATLRAWREQSLSEFSAAASHVWLGDIDYNLNEHGGLEEELRESAISLAADSGVAGVKFGVYCEPNPGRAAGFIRSYITSAHARGVSVMPEPYLGDLAAQQRLSVLAAGHGAAAMKCDVADPRRWAASYSSASGTNWLARSDGISFDTFITRLEIAAAEGCSGAVVGRALWHEPLSQESSMDTVLSMVRARLGEMRMVVGKDRGNDLPIGD